MDKLPFSSTKLQSPTAEARRRAVRPTGFHALLACALSLVFVAAGWAGPARSTFTAISRWLPAAPKSDVWAANRSSFRWSDIAPSTTLNYTPCFSEYLCARLTVPLNWNASAEERATGPQLVIAIVKLPAKVPVTDPRYGGPILINPGGPGESGIHQVLSDGKNLQTVVDAPTLPNTDHSGEARYFDLLGFDPRGVNNSEPSLRCFPDALSQKAWLLRYPDYGLLWDSESIIGMEWAGATALGASCSSAEAGGERLRYVNTAQVVGDMVEIVEKEGEWRAREAERLLSRPVSPSPEPKEDVLARTTYLPGLEKIQYWGKSYGTVIGSTFAAMHPERVHRIVLDGVVDPADHFAGDWLTQLHDSDMIITKFCEYCYQAGPTKCPLFTGSSGADVEARLNAIMHSLAVEPIAVVSSSDGKNPSPEMVTYGDVHMHLLTAMYFSFAHAEHYFTLLKSLESRNATSPDLANIVAGKQGILEPSECVLDEPFDSCVPYIAMMGPNQAISCMDSGGVTNLTREGFAAYLTVLKSQGRWISRSWARNKLACLGSTVATAWRPSWLFKTQEWANTSHPLLVLGNSHDTVTPVRNARRVASLFPGSVVLRQNSEGHCSHSNPSVCTGKVVRAYFQTGSLPDESLVCEPEVRPFLGCVATGASECQFSNADDETLWRAMMDMADPFGVKSLPSEDSSRLLASNLHRMGHLG